MAIRAEVGGRVVAEFPDGTPQDVIDKAVKRDLPLYTPEGEMNARSPLDPVGTMEGMIVPKDQTGSRPFRPVRNAAAGLAEGVNLGAAKVAGGLNTMYNYINEKIEAGANPDFFKEAMGKYMGNADYWEKVAQEGGISKAWHFLTKAVGEAPMTIADFMTGPGAAATKGAAAAKEEGKSEIVGGAKSAAEWMLMKGVLGQAGKLKPAPRMATGAGVFGGQAAAQGGTAEQIGEAAITGAMYGAPGGSRGKVPIKDLGKAAFEANKEIGERGAVGDKPKLVPAVKVGDQVFAVDMDKAGTHGDAYNKVPPELLQKAANGEVDLESGYMDVKGGWVPDKEAQARFNKEGGAKPSLVPAIKYEGKTVKGEVGDTHPDVMKRNDIGPEAEHERGFMTPDGKYLSRARAKQWMKKNNPELYKEWVKVNEDGGEKGELHSQDLNKAQDTTLGFGLGAVPDKMLQGLDRWLSPTKEKLAGQSEPKAPAEEWSKRIAAWVDKNPHIKDENQWNGLTAWLDSKKGERGGVQKTDIMEFLELSKGKWAVREQTHGINNDKNAKRVEELNSKADLTPGETQELRNLKDGWLYSTVDPWSDRNIPGGIPGTEKVYTLSSPTDRIDSSLSRGNLDKERRFLDARHEAGQMSDQEYNSKLADLELAGKDDRSGAYWSPHFVDKPNVVVHFRTQEHLDSKGEKGILIETIQSDWHQQGTPAPKEIQELVKRERDGAKLTPEEDRKVEDYKFSIGLDHKVNMTPPAPFEKTWAEQGLKHALDIAAQDPSVKWVGWAGGKVQNERWGKKDATDEPTTIHFRKTRDGRWDASTIGEDRTETISLKGNDQDIDHIFGKGTAAAMRKEWEDPNRTEEKIELDWTMPGDSSFLTTLYDKRLPKFAKKYAEKMGGTYKTDTLSVKNPKDDQIAEITKEYKEGKISKGEYQDLLYEARDSEDATQDISSAGIHRIDLTPALRTSINTKGQQFYQMAAPVAGAAVAKAVLGDGDDKKKKRWLESRQNEKVLERRGVQ